MNQFIYKVHFKGKTKPKLIEARNLDDFRNKSMKAFKRAKIDTNLVWRVEKFELQGSISNY
mgnify:CR=1 FL=1|jgi:hypothetical protein